jgi:RHS repeat-associated protein
MKTTRILSLAMTMAMGMIAGLQASVTEHQPPAPLPEFKTPAQLAKWRKEMTAKTSAQEASRLSTLDSSTPFYTGKPYLAESGSYAFKYREYNPEMNRWTTVDPSGFPDGANNRVYAPIVTIQIDPTGLVTINSLSDALNYWRRSNGSTSDTVTLGGSIINDIKSCSGFTDLIALIQNQRIEPGLQAVSTQDWSGNFDSGGTKGPASIGYVDVVIGRSSISYNDSTSWWANSGWNNRSRKLEGSTTMNFTVNDTFDFTSNSNDSLWMNLIEETIPGFIAGPGTSFKMTGSSSYNYKTITQQYE